MKLYIKYIQTELVFGKLAFVPPFFASTCGIYSWKIYTRWVYLIFSLILFANTSIAFSQSSEEYPQKVDLDTFPVPQIKNLLFYIQKNANTNTITYQAMFDENGKLDENEPARSFWLRYEKEGGKESELNFIERVVAYGLNIDKIEGQEDYFTVTVKSHKARVFTLFVDDKGIARMQTIIDNKQAYIKHAFIQIEGPTIWPTVKYVDIWGEDPITGVPIFERMIVDKQ